MIGILAEKSSAAKKMATAFGGMSGTYNGESYVIAAARGHLYELADPEKQVDASLAAKYKSWSLSNLPWNETEFKWLYQKQKDLPASRQTVKEILNNISTTFANCDEICIATDNDPSGEGTLLADEILFGLGIKNKKWSRMFFVDESVKGFQNAFQTRKYFNSLLDDPDYIKAFYRSRWDFLSMQFTRIATACGDGHSILRQGRLKSAMVKMVGDQLSLCAAYQKIPFYQNRFKDENGVVYTDPKEPQFPKKEDVDTAKYHASDVVCDEKNIKRVAPPELLDLAGLASLLAAKGYKTKHVQTVYQKMYEAQIVSYPRTEDKTITPEQFNELLPLVNNIADVVGVDTALLTHMQPRDTHVKTGGAHGANRPGTNVPASLDALLPYGDCAAEIYTILAKNYLAMLAEDYEYEAQKGHVKDFPTFKGTASVPQKPGWKLIFHDVDMDSVDENAKGLGTMADPFIHEGFPTPPTKPTMKWLMLQLKKRDVGTGATRASTYAEVTSTSTKYPLLKDTKGRLSMTNLGEMSYLLLPGTNIGSLDVTEKLTAQMREVAEGKLDPEAGLAMIQQMVREDMATMKANSVAMRQSLGITVSATSAAEKHAGIWNGKPVAFKKAWSGHDFTDEECEKLCNGETITFEATSKSGKVYKVTGDLAEQSFNKDGKTIKYIGFHKISAEGEDSMTDTADRYSGTWNGKPVAFKRNWSGHYFTDEECEKLCNGEEITIEAVSAKNNNKPYKCKGILAEQTFQGHAFVGFSRTGFVNDDSQAGGGGIPDEFCKHKFTTDELAMLQAGMTVYATDWVSRKGSKFPAKCSYGMKEDGRMGFKFQFDD